jgi:NAD+ synthase (glutamine-hydrolysing)
MKNDWRIGIAQINCTVGDLKGNCDKILSFTERARDYGADIVVFPEMAVTGYPPEDLLLKPKFIADNVSALGALARGIKGILAIIGFVDRKGTKLFNAAAVVMDGAVKGIYHKMLLPNYSVFDEKRYFEPGSKALVFRLDDLTFGVNICEDIWFSNGPTKAQAARGATLILNVNASPYYLGKARLRERIVKGLALEHRLFLAHTNLVGGQDELVFDGQSIVTDPLGHVVARGLPFREDLIIIDLAIPASEQTRKAEDGTVLADPTDTILLGELGRRKARPALPPRKADTLKPAPEVYEALLLGLGDYVRKNGFRKVLIGLSGGVDSALVAALAVDSLGKENVVGVFMPSRFTSEESRIDAGDLARNLGIEFLTVPIDSVFSAYLSTLEPVFADCGPDTTEENIQARIRGNILMAMSNKFGWLVLTTGNKSEMSVGYATLYGDMAGGFAVIKDVPKTLVYDLCRYRNDINPIIPENVLVKEPTAELKADQKDSDSLPVYGALDPILKAYVEEDRSMAAIIASGLDGATVESVVRMVDVSEYKRRQAPPGIKITPKAFGKDRRMPITNKYRG